MARNVQTDLILLEIAEGLRALSVDDNLSQKIKDAHELSDSEKAKLDEAKAIIAQADQLRADLKKKEDSLADVNERIAEAEKLEAFNADTLADINCLNNELATQQEVNLQDAKNNAAEKLRLSKLSDSLDERAAKVADAEKEIEKAKADLKKRADAVQAQTIGL